MKDKEPFTCNHNIPEGMDPDLVHIIHHPLCNGSTNKKPAIPVKPILIGENIEHPKPEDVKPPVFAGT